MRVLHVINGLSTGGAESLLYRVITKLSHVDHEVVCLEQPARFSPMLEEHGIKVHHLNWGAKLLERPVKVDRSHAVGTFRAATRLHQIIRSSDADLVQAWMYRSNLFAGISSRIVGKPVVWGIHCSSPWMARLATGLLACAGGVVARWAADFVINCSARSAALHAKWGYGAAAGAVIPNGYDPSVFRPDEQQRLLTRQSIGIGRGEFVIGTVGRWHPQKGYAILIRALRLLRERGVNLHLLMIGRDLDESNTHLMKLIHEEGCEAFVRLLGERADMPELDRALDLHVLPSATEAFPSVVCETMLSGTPNVATDVGDTSLIVGRTGWLIAPDDAEAIAAAIQHAHREWREPSSKWRQRCEASRQRIVDNFSLERMANAYQEVWTTVMKKTRKVPKSVAFL